MPQKYGSVVVPGGTLGLFSVTNVGFIPSNIAVTASEDGGSVICRGVVAFAIENSFWESVVGGSRVVTVVAGYMISGVGRVLLESLDPDGFTLNFVIAPINDVIILFDARA